MGDTVRDTLSICVHKKITIYVQYIICNCIAIETTNNNNVEPFNVDINATSIHLFENSTCCMPSCM